jgi:hypothetical protein
MAKIDPKKYSNSKDYNGINDVEDGFRPDHDREEPHRIKGETNASPKGLTIGDSDNTNAAN